MLIIKGKKKVIKLADLLNERKVDGMVFVDKWKKALKLLKQKGGWSPHFRKGSEPVGYTNSDILCKIPKRYEDKSWFAFHAQAMSSAMSRGGMYWEKPMMLSWDGDVKLLKRVLTRAGFKVSGGRRDTEKIILKVK